jgi:hypothetical protein
MSEDDVFFGYRLQLFDYTARTSVSAREPHVEADVPARWSASTASSSGG